MFGGENTDLGIGQSQQRRQGPAALQRLCASFFLVTLLFLFFLPSLFLFRSPRSPFLLLLLLPALVPSSLLSTCFHLMSSHIPALLTTQPHLAARYTSAPCYNSCRWPLLVVRIHRT